MRYYDIRFTDPDGNLLKNFGFARYGLDTTYSSFVDGKSIPGALNVEFNIPQAPYATPRQGAWLRVWGVGLDELAKSASLGPYVDSATGNFKLNGVTIRAGMKPGLPLATALSQRVGQNTTIVEGSIFKPFGNWEYTSQTIDMTLLPAVGTNDGQPVNITFDYKAGGSISEAITQALTQALPKYKVKVVVSDKLVSSADMQGVYTTLNQFSAMIIKYSLQQQFAGIRTQAGGAYGGVNVRIVGRSITVYDGTDDYSTNTLSNPKALVFEDFIGQPTWLGPVTITFKTVLRADINVGDYVKLPSTLAIPYVLSTPNAVIPGVPSRNSLTFQGKFIVINVNHYGNSRSPDASAWCTVYVAAFVSNPSAIIAVPAPTGAKVNSFALTPLPGGGIAPPS